MTDHVVTTPAGRQIGLSAIGDPAADRLVLFFHPTPGAGLFDPDPPVTQRWGVHIVEPDRPGYGASPDPEPGTESVAAVVDDIAAWMSRAERNADRISAAHFAAIGVIGWGEGGLYAAALAARHPDLVDRLVLVETPAPDGEAAERLGARSLDASAPFDVLGVADDPDLDRLGLPGRLERMVENAAGPRGAVDTAADLAAIRADGWDQPYGAIEAATLLVYGTKDPSIDRSDAKWFKRRIPHARLKMVANTRKLVLVSRWEDILEHVAPNHGSLAPQFRDDGSATEATNARR